MGLALVAAAALWTGEARAQTPPNDECASPAPIAGPGGFNLDDLLTATQTTTPPPIPGTTKDVWFCWTATWTGTAKLDVSGALLYGQVFAGCGCPNSASAMLAFTSPGLPPAVFQVECNQRYMIRLGAEQYPFPAQNPVRALTLSKVSGQDCPPPQAGTCGDCCGGKPTFSDPIYQTNFTGQVAVMNQNYLGLFGSGGQIITIFNLAATPAPTPGLPWDPVTGPPSTAFRYSKPNWDFQTLGSVFPLTLDSTGNIYTAYCAATNAPSPSNLPGSTSGSIFKIPVGTGMPQVFCNLPDNLAPAVGNCAGGGLVPCTTPNPCPPGIGDVCSDCANSQFFASHFADGRIYRVNSAGVPVEAYDHATDAVQPPTREVGNSYMRYVPRGERVWAVKVHQGRVFYSTWGQDLGCSGSLNTIGIGSQPNRIWSIGLTATGAFLPGSRRMELQVSAYPPASTTNGPINPQQSCPISDISFGPTCRMLLAERAMGDNGVALGAHDARALEYAYNGTAWVPVNARGGFGLEIGQQPVGLPNTNSAGGCDYDFATGALPLGREWITGDYLYNPPLIYGITGLDPAAPALATAIHIDNEDSFGFDKTKICDVEVNCPGQCGTLNDEHILCSTTLPGNYTYSFTITNNTLVPVRYLLFPSPNMTPHVVTLATPLLPTQTSPVITVNINGPVTSPFCFDVTMADEEVHECCRLHHCLVLPNCNCLQIPQISAECVPGHPGQYTLTFTVQNLSWYVIDELYLFPPIGSGAAFNPDYFSFTPTPPTGIAGPFVTTITGGIPGPFCFRISVHHDGEECCSEVECVTLPGPCPDRPLPCTAGGLCYFDCDGSGFLNINDFMCFLNHYAAGDACANCDGSTIPPVLNINDFICFQNGFATGCP